MQDSVLTTPMPWRLAFTFAAVFFGAGLAWNVRRMALGEFEWTTTYKIGIPILVLIVLGALVGAVSSWTSRFWIDNERGVLHQRILFSDVSRSLAPPTTVAFDYTPPALGSTVVGTWTVLVRTPGEPTLKVNTPFVGDIADVARLLQPALRANPDLPADEVSRQAIEDPSTLRAPTGM